MTSAQEDAFMEALGLSGEQRSQLRQRAREHGRGVVEEMRVSILDGISVDAIRQAHAPVVHQYKSKWDRTTSRMAGVYQPEGKICREDGQRFPCTTLRIIEGGR